MLFDLALRNGYGQYKTTILLTDGAIWIKNMKDLLFPDSVHILDFYHLCEKVHNFSKEYFDNNESKYRTFADKTCNMLRNSEVYDVLNILDSLNKDKISNCIFNLYDYIVNNINSIDYKAYGDNDWFIGSDAIESANKTALQERLKQAGMRWNLDTARYITALMTKAKSNLWERDVVQALYRYYGVTCLSDNNFCLH
jgi:hypothetical protein